MKRFYLLTLAATTLAMAVTAREYKPLLEQGKEWHYTGVLWHGVYHPDWCQDDPREIKETLKLEGTAMIDGEEYFKLNAYFDIENTGWCHNPIAYLREDNDTRKVKIRINEECGDAQVEQLEGLIRESGNDLVYDFTYTDMTYIVDWGKAYGEETWLECNDGMRSGVTLVTKEGEPTPYSIIEGIGLVRTSEGGGFYNGSCYLLFYGESFLDAYPCYYYWPYLYEVVSGNGEVIYYNENFAPGFAGILTAKADNDATVRVFNLQGMKVKECDAAANPTDGLAPGVYLIRTGGVTSKIHIGI